jgi:hypothetical protein
MAAVASGYLIVTDGPHAWTHAETDPLDSRRRCPGIPIRRHSRSRRETGSRPSWAAGDAGGRSAALPMVRISLLTDIDRMVGAGANASVIASNGTR